jgi:hypothetical protein
MLPLAMLYATPALYAQGISEIGGKLKRSIKEKASCWKLRRESGRDIEYPEVEQV